MKMMNNFLRKRYKGRGYKGKQLELRISEYKRNLRVGYIITCAFIILLVVLFQLTVYTSYGAKAKEKIKGFTIDTYFGKVSNEYKSDAIIVSIAEICSHFDIEKNQIRCVYNFVDEFFTYENHNDEMNIFRTPKEIINEGGVCRDYTVFYRAIFELMGYKTEFIQEPNHIYLRVFGEEVNYVIDQNFYSVEEDE